MITDWTKHLSDPGEKKELEQIIKSSLVALGRLRELVEEYNNEITKLELKPDSYDNPSWAYKQAYLNGRKYELSRLKNLLTL